MLREMEDLRNLGVWALTLREMEDLRSLSIGSPVPTPRTDDDVDLFTHDDESLSKFPAIKIDRCLTDARLDVDQRSSTTGQTDHRRAPSDHVDVTTDTGVPPRSTTSNHAAAANQR